ncbi:MAG: bifunctional adenosylcobinamide kinase/adenosylcobinamide-phosphate guanylyltransferase [bacterium]|nr:bifunctional adenosylcobinamide kinase/adenosylcobinamide-phosphate guanylyltransferase [bacterium]MDE0289503.1 bifunctional adenosylcobinamide kinase/adenosylcobinamide-phosphate guanylyltransferase [bacterium]MDE0438479.1 bifunctional adenosylcobinamide kinase/adenosylcobinamide-phosphate guanylyltransferase [bacterium]
MPDSSDRSAARPDELVLVLGGARSGKSTAAERMARDGGRVLFIATAEALDEAMRRRIASHRRYRPDHWDTLEEPIHVGDAVRPLIGRYDTFVLDCLTLWVSNLLLADEEDSGVEGMILETVGRLLDLIDEGGGRWILVSNEVGQGIVPASALAREYRDVLGRVNQLVASRADKAYLMVAGLALDLRHLEDRVSTGGSG